MPDTLRGLRVLWGGLYGTWGSILFLATFVPMLYSSTISPNVLPPALTFFVCMISGIMTGFAASRVQMVLALAHEEKRPFVEMARWYATYLDFHAQLVRIWWHPLTWVPRTPTPVWKEHVARCRATRDDNSPN